MNAPLPAPAAPAREAASAAPASMLDQALWLLEKGLHVFPLGAYGESPPGHFVLGRYKGDVEKAKAHWPKHPLVFWRAFQRAAPSEALVHTWWANSPNANIGIACGHLVVVDADSDESVAWCTANLPCTPWKVRTGKGKHFYFKANPECEVKNSAHPSRIDTRGMGGYVVAGGSRHASGGFYVNEIDPNVSNIMVSDLPVLAQEDVDAIAAYRASVGGAVGNGTGNLAGFDASLAKTKADGSPVAEGGRNNAAASLAGQCFAKGLSLHETKQKLDDWNASNQPPLSDDELNTTIASIKMTHERNHPDLPIPLESQLPRDDIRLVEKVEEIAPTAADRIPGVLGQVEDYYNRTSIIRQPAFACAAAIALGSVALGRLYVARAMLDSYSSVYLCEMGSTGCGKEHARTVIEEFLLAAQLNSLIGPNGYTHPAGVHSTLLAQPAHITCLNELGRHLASLKSGKDSSQIQVLTELMQVYGAQHSSYRYRGYSTVHLNAAERAEVTKFTLSPAITLLGVSTPDSLFSAIGVAGLVDGFLNRMLFFFGDDDARADPFGDRRKSVLPADVIAWLKNVRTRKGDIWQNSPHDVRPDPEILAFDDPAVRVMRGLMAEVEMRKVGAAKNGVKDVWVRTVEKAFKLALIAAVSDNCQQIGQLHAEWAARKALASDAALEHAATGNIAESEHGKLCNSIYRAVAARMPAGVAEGKLASVCWAYRDAAPWDRKAALETLIADGRLVREVRSGGNGRSATYLLATRVIDEKGQ
jgi:hypothetical protein